MEHYHPKDEMKRYVRAFIYLATKLGKEKSVAEDLWRIPEIKEVHIVPGKYDILAVAEVERKFLEPDTQNIYWFLLSRIEGISGIEDTSTIIPVLSMSHWSHSREKQHNTPAYWSGATFGFFSGAREAGSCASGSRRTSSPVRSVTAVDEVVGHVSHSLPFVSTSNRRIRPDKRIVDQHYSITSHYSQQTWGYHRRFC